VFSLGLTTWFSGAQMIELNDGDATGVEGIYANNPPAGNGTGVWWFFPETREVTAHSFPTSSTGGTRSETMEGSVNSTNGMDGTWETASLPNGIGVLPLTGDAWRLTIRPVSFTGGKKVIRVHVGSDVGGDRLAALHLYGEKVAGQTPDDLIFINHDDTPGVEYTAPEDFGDQPLGTTVVRQFRLKNASATKTANSVNIQCNDADFAISEDNSSWVVTINIDSLAAGAESATLYVRCTTPSPGAVLGPRFARIVALVSSWS
jgi:hypothetical protein